MISNLGCTILSSKLKHFLSLEQKLIKVRVSEKYKFQEAPETSKIQLPLKGTRAGDNW